MTLLEDFEALCKYVRECTGDDIVCGLCEYDAGTVGEEPIECPGFESNECFVLKESLRKQYEMYDQVTRCKDCRYYDAGAKTMLDILLAFCFALLTFLAVIVICCVLINGGDE